MQSESSVVNFGFGRRKAVSFCKGLKINDLVDRPSPPPPWLKPMLRHCAHSILYLFLYSQSPPLSLSLSQLHTPSHNISPLLSLSLSCTNPFALFVHTQTLTHAHKQTPMHIHSITQIYLFHPPTHLLYFFRSLPISLSLSLWIYMNIEIRLFNKTNTQLRDPTCNNETSHKYKSIG